METNFEMKKPYCPVIDINGQIANGKQFDLDITLPEDHRNVIYGVVKNCFKEPVENAVVKLIEVDRKDCIEERKPICHTFTDKFGEFVFGPLCPNKEYAIDIWVNDVKHVKVCAKCHHEGKCLKGVKTDCDCFMDKKDYNYKKEDYKENYKEYDNKEKDFKKEDYKEEDNKDDCKKENYQKDSFKKN